MARELQNWGLNLQTTVDVDVALIPSVNVNSPEFKELLVRLYQSVSDIQRTVNLKESGYKLTTEFNTGKNLFNVNNDFNNLRPIYNVEVDFGALPNAATKSVAHGIANIDANFKLVSIFAGATKPTMPFSYIPVTYASASATANNIEINMDATNVNITTAIDYSAYTTTYVTIEFVRI